MGVEVEHGVDDDGLLGGRVCNDVLLDPVLGLEARVYN